MLAEWLPLPGVREHLERLSRGADLDLIHYGTEADAETIKDTAVAQPLIVAASAELARPGDFRTVDIDGVSALIVRQADGRLAAFHNVCRHRGARILTEPKGSTRKFCLLYTSPSPRD